MPRANRCILPGYTYHLTHRCHNRSWLLKFARDRTEYCKRLRMSVREFRVSLLTFSVTSNHTHLLVRAKEPEYVSALMQKLEGEFAEYYNIRKRRSGAFWAGRYHCTMIGDEQYLWNCMKYIDLNMVRAGVVGHPQEWRWCGFSELTGLRQRYRMLDRAEVLRMHDGCTAEEFAESYRATIDESLALRSAANSTAGRAEGLERDQMWTESIAVGSETFVRKIEQETRSRMELDITPTSSGAWTIRETPEPYA